MCGKCGKCGSVLSAGVVRGGAKWRKVQVLTSHSRIGEKIRCLFTSVHALYRVSVQLSVEWVRCVLAWLCALIVRRMCVGRAGRGKMLESASFNFSLAHRRVKWLFIRGYAFQCHMCVCA